MGNNCVCLKILNSCENKYSVNELELLAAVWAIEHFKYYLYGRKLTLITDHQALVSALQCKKNNKVYQSRLTRWIYRLLPFDFDIKHLAGSKMGLIDYIPRHPVGKPQLPAYWDEQVVVALIDDFIAHLEFQDSASLNLALNSNPNGTFNTQKLDRNENDSHPDSFETANAFTLNSHKSTFSRSENCKQFKNHNFVPNISEKKISHHTNMNRQLSISTSGMSLPPFKPILRKCHKGAQTTISFHPKNISSFDTYKQLHKDLNFSDTSHQVIPSKDSMTIQPIPVNQGCQTEQEEETQTCSATAVTQDEDVPMYRRQLRNVFGSSFLAAATKKDRSLNPLLNMVKVQKWDTRKSCYGPSFYNSDTDSQCETASFCPKQLRQTLVDALHLTHPGQGGMLEAARNIWYPYLHRDIVATAQNCKECREKGKNLKVISGHSHFTSLDAVVEPNEEIQLDFAGPLPDENDKVVYILVGVDRFSRFPSAKVVTNNQADTIIRFMQTHIVNHGVPQNIRFDQAQGFRAKKFMVYCKNNNIKLIFAPVDDHRSIGMVERLIRTLKSRLSVMKIDNRNKPYKLASDVAELIKTLRIAPNATTKITPFEAHFGRKSKTPLSNIAKSPKLSNLSWENIKLACLDQKLLTKPALTAEAMWNRDVNSEDKLDINYRQKQQEPQLVPDNMPS